MSRFIAVALGGALGAMSRYAVALFVAMFWKRDFPSRSIDTSAVRARPLSRCRA